MFLRECNGTPQSLAVIADVVAFAAEDRAWIRVVPISEPTEVDMEDWTVNEVVTLAPTD